MVQAGRTDDNGIEADFFGKSHRKEPKYPFDYAQGKQSTRAQEKNQKISGTALHAYILKGAEVNIRKGGSLDVSDNVLEKLDVVGASVHSYFNLSRGEQTERLIKAMKNPHVDIISHLTGRLFGKREGIDLDIDEVLKAAKESGTILEINAQPFRLDLSDENIRRAKKMGLKVSIGTDSHSIPDYSLNIYGISQARRGWCEKKDVINTLSLRKMLKFLKKPKNKRL